MLFQMKMVIGIGGMHCDHCKKRVEEGIQSLDFVKSVKVDLKKGQASIVLKKDMEFKEEMVQKAIEDLGFSYEGVLLS